MTGGFRLPVNEGRVRKLMEYGLTEYQARVYLALTGVGVASASDIPALSRVPRTRIYSTMQQLHEKGLVQILPERPLRYRPVPLASYIHSLAQDHRSRASQLATQADALSAEFPISESQAPLMKGGFEALYGRRNVRDRLIRMYESAEQTILCIGSSMTPARMRHALAPTLRDRHANGVTVRLAFYITPENLADALALSRFAEIRGIDFFTPVYRHGVDGKQFLMGHPVPDDESGYRGEDIAIWTDDPAISGAMAQMTAKIWEMGRPLDRRLRKSVGRRAVSSGGS